MRGLMRRVCVSFPIFPSFFPLNFFTLSLSCYLSSPISLPAVFSPYPGGLLICYFTLFTTVISYTVSPHLSTKHFLPSFLLPPHSLTSHRGHPPPPTILLPQHEHHPRSSHQLRHWQRRRPPSAQALHLVVFSLLFAEPKRLHRPGHVASGKAV